MSTWRATLGAPAVLVVLAGVVAWIYRQPPQLGDDLDYWSLAMSLRLGEPGAWNADSFHDLRWPVWGLCWLLMGPLGITAASYYLQPALYLAAGACLVAWLAGRAGLGPWGRLCAGVVFVMHPLLDAAITRPMPDLSEGFWVALAFGLWLAMVERRAGWGKVALCAAVGLALAVAQANRITGVFAVPVLVVCTLALRPRALGWLVLCGVFAATFVLAEWMVYRALTGDLLHSIHANLGARGRKGTEVMAAWELPVRFLPALWRQPQDIIASLLALAGMVVAWRSGRLPARAIAIHAVVYYLSYSCTPQSLDPLRPLVRDGDRFLASLAYPLSVLTTFGLLGAWSLVRRLPGGFAGRLERVPWLGVAGVAVLLAASSNRTIGEPDYLPAIAEVVRSKPAGTTVVSHPPLRAVAQLAAPDLAPTLDWRLHRNILEPSPKLAADLASAHNVWLIRKHAWIVNRKRSETGAAGQLPALAPFLELQGWRPARSELKGDVPDFVFLERSDDPGARLDIAFLLGDLPRRWDLQPGDWHSERLPVPEDLRGAEVFLRLRSASDRTEPIRVRLDFLGARRQRIEILFKPYTFRTSSPDFFAFRIPAWAEDFQLRVRTDSNATTYSLDALDVAVFRPGSP